MDIWSLANSSNTNRCIHVSQALKKLPPFVQLGIATQESTGIHLVSVEAVILIGLYPGKHATQPIAYPHGLPEPSSDAWITASPALSVLTTASPQPVV